MLYSKHSIPLGKILQNFFHSSSLTIIPFSSPFRLYHLGHHIVKPFRSSTFHRNRLKKKEQSFRFSVYPSLIVSRINSKHSNRTFRKSNAFQRVSKTWQTRICGAKKFLELSDNASRILRLFPPATRAIPARVGGAAEGMIIIANERFSLNCLPTIIFLSLFPSPSLRKTAAFISTPDHLGEYGWRGGWWLIYSEKLGWNIGISWRKGREAWRVSQSMGFASFCFVSEMSSLPPPHCVATSRWRGKILPGKEKGKVKRLKGGFGIWSWAVTLELFRDLHALETPVFGHAEDEEGKRKILACLIP